MKKVYAKPQIAFEDFSLNVSIATCEDKSYGNAAKDSCGFLVPEWNRVVFISETTGCNDIQAPDGNYNGICYDNPSGLIDLFNS